MQIDLLNNALRLRERTRSINALIGLRTMTAGLIDTELDPDHPRREGVGATIKPCFRSFVSAPLTWHLRARVTSACCGGSVRCAPGRWRRRGGASDVCPDGGERLGSGSAWDALPHARVGGINEPVVAVVRTVHPVAFDEGAVTLSVGIRRRSRRPRRTLNCSVLGVVAARRCGVALLLLKTLRR